MVREGRLCGIAVTGARRDPALPDVPTVAEQGSAGFEALTWFGMMAPAGTPPAIADRTSAEVSRALSVPEVRQRLDAAGFAPDPRARPDFAGFLRAEVAQRAEVVRVSGATAD
jgi:tripartite-type tricarboxylate transporter receptor subunit TctC